MAPMISSRGGTVPAGARISPASEPRQLSVPVLLSRACQLADTWLQRRKGRISLASLTDDQLRDIGVSRSEALREAARPFWYG